MIRFSTLGTVALFGAAAIALAGCEPMSPTDVGGMGVGMVTPQQQDQICLDAVKAETGATTASVLISDHDGGSSEIVSGRTYDSVVTVGVGDNSEPYHCLIDDDGVVGDIHRVSSTHSPG
jgi:hypothetical protein